MSYPIVQFGAFQCSLKFDRYQKGKAVSIHLVDAKDGLPVATATVNIPEARIQKDECLIKDYSENAGILNALIASKIVQPTERTVPAGFANAIVCKLLVTPPNP